MDAPDDVEFLPEVIEVRKDDVSLENIEVYRLADVQWPPPLQAGLEDVYNRCSDRSYECLWFLVNKCPACPSTGQIPEYSVVDLDVSLPRLLGSDLKSLEPKHWQERCPWQFPLGTIICSAQICMRRHCGGCHFEYKMQSSKELFSLIGWHESELNTIPDYPLSVKMCGNSFSAYHLCPIWIAFNLARSAPDSFKPTS